MTLKIVVLDGFTLNPGDNPWDRLESLGKAHIYERTPPDQVVGRAKDANILVVNKVRIGREELQCLPHLQFIAVTATGYDCVDVSAAQERGIPVANVPVYGTDSVAQHVFALLLHVLHRVDLHDQAVHRGQWSECGDFSFWLFPLTELANKTMGIIGYGRIGRRVAEIATAMGMRVIANSRSRRNGLPNDSFSWADTRQIAESSDVISLHCPLTEETKGLVNAQFLAKCKPSAVLINTGRGPLIVEEDLAAALERKQIRAAAVDVVSEEPIRDDNPLLRVENCFITPHQAWATIEARRRLMNTTIENIEAFIQGRPQNVVNGVTGATE